MSHTNNAARFFSHTMPQAIEDMRNLRKEPVTHFTGILNIEGAECVGNRSTLLGCAEKLHSYTTHINPRARFPYNAICNADMKALIQSWKTPQDWPSHNKFIPAEQDILFILLVNEATQGEA